MTDPDSTHLRWPTSAAAEGPGCRARRRPRKQWLSVVADQRASGLTVAEYCERNGMSRATMTRYLAFARKCKTAPDRVKRATVARAEGADSVARFLPIGVVTQADAGRSVSDTEFPELILGEGIRIRLPPLALERLLEAVLSRIAGARP